MLLENSLLPLFECHNGCRCCSKHCGNRACGESQLHLPTCEVRQTESKGFGLFSVDEIKCGSIVIEYLGEVLPRSEAERRIKSIAGSRNYMLEVREHYADTVIHTYIDATHFGNESRFVNHSCDPNCAIQIVCVVYFFKIDSHQHTDPSYRTCSNARYSSGRGNHVSLWRYFRPDLL